MKFNAFDNATISAIRFSELFGFNPKLSFNQALQQHPYYPSLFSISEVLDINQYAGAPYQGTMNGDMAFVNQLIINARF